MNLKISSVKRQPFRLGINVLSICPAGIYKPEDPPISIESRELWIRSYIEARWSMMGRDADNIPDVVVDLFKSRFEILEIVSTNDTSGTEW